MFVPSTYTHSLSHMRSQQINTLYTHPPSPCPLHTLPPSPCPLNTHPPSPCPLYTHPPSPCPLHTLPDDRLDGYQKKKYVCKLLFIFLLGNDIDFGHQEAVNLLSSVRFSEKQIVSLERGKAACYHVLQ